MAPDRPREGGSCSIDLADLAKWLLLGCVTAVLFFIFIDYHINYGVAIDIGAIRRLSNIAREDGLASWFGTTQKLLVGLTLWLIYFSTRHRTERRLPRVGWLVLAAFFTWMAVDDGAQLHERIGSAFSSVFDAESGDSGTLVGFPSYTWMVVFLPIFASIGVFGFYFLWVELPRPRQRALVATAFLFMAIAVGLDFVEGLDEGHPLNLHVWFIELIGIDDWTIYRFGQEPYETVVHFSKSLEESLEILADSLLWFVFLGYVAESIRRLDVRFTRD